MAWSTLRLISAASSHILETNEIDVLLCLFSDDDDDDF